MFVHDPAKCIYISRGLIAGGWECGTISAIINIMKRKPDGDRGYFMDIGANIGSLSLAVAHSGFNVVAFEAMTFNVELQQASAGTFPPGGKLHLFHTALSSGDGKEMCVAAAKGGEPIVNTGNGQLTFNCDPSSEHVSLRSIDSILSQDKTLNGECFSVIKADIEGFESLAFEGAINIFTGPCPPCAVFFEYNKEYTLMATNVERAPFDFLNAYGYSCEFVEGADYRCNLETSPYKARCLG
jgi:FkbM family methyltransferase